MTKNANMKITDKEKLNLLAEAIVCGEGERAGCSDGETASIRQFTNDIHSINTKDGFKKFTAELVSKIAYGGI